MAPYKTEYSDFIDSGYTSGDIIKYLKKSFNYNLPERLLSLEEIFELDKSIIKYRVSAIFLQICTNNDEMFLIYINFGYDCHKEFVKSFGNTIYTPLNFGKRFKNHNFKFITSF